MVFFKEEDAMKYHATTGPVENKSTLSRGKKMVLIVFVIWAAQAVPKWSAAIMADGETSAKIVGYFITPKYQMM